MTVLVLGGGGSLWFLQGTLAQGLSAPVLGFEAKLRHKEGKNIFDSLREKRPNLQSRVSEGSVKMKEALTPSHCILLEEEPEGHLCASSQLH